MNIRKTALPAIVAAALLAAAVLPSCKKKSTTDTLDYLEGTMKYNLPVYVNPGDTYVISPSGVTHPEGGRIGYYVYTSWNSKRDTIRSVNSTDTSPVTYTLTIPDELGEGYDFTCYAYATDYYSVSKTTSMTIVGDKMTDVFTGLDYADDDPTFTDTRDGMEYRTVTIGSDEWFRQNLSYNECGVPFSNCPAMTRITGNFYSWEEARTVCPDGWHLSTESEWLAIGKELTGDDGLQAHDMFPGVSGSLMVDARFFESRMWEYRPNDVVITNKLKFNGLSFGYATSADSGEPRFSGPNEYAVFWTADEDDSDSSKAWLRYFHYKQADVLSGTADKKTFLANVRCVKNK